MTNVKRTHYLNVASLLAVMIVTYGCSPDELTQKHVSNVKARQIVLGKKLQNPYSVKIMQQAYEKVRALNSAGRTQQELDIRTTHLYVRFLPANYAQYDTLTSDTTIYFEDHPIDYEIEHPGDYYHDPAIADSLPTYQYTAVPIDYVAPDGLAFEILDELYLPKEDSALEDAGGRVSQQTEQLIDELEYQALSLTGNLPGDALSTGHNGRTAGWLPSKFTPKGSIHVWDSRLGVIPLAGAKVRTRRWFEVHEAITDDEGNFRADGTYRYNFNYNVVWERAMFDIRSGYLGQAILDGPRMKADWHLTIDGGVQGFYAHIFRGALRYFYKDIGGLKRPGVWAKMKICAFDENNNNKYGQNNGNWDFTGILPDIKIWRFAQGRERGSDEIFSTAVHEIAHSSHIELLRFGDLQSHDVSDLIFESWAVAVQWYITSMEYRERGISNYADPWWYSGIADYRLNYAFQKDSQGNYTCLFIDLVDDHNQAGRFLNAFTDNVTGYTLAEIEAKVLRQAYGLHSLRDKLLAHKPAGVQSAQIIELIDQF